MLRRLHALSLRYAAVHADRLHSVSLGPLLRRFGQVEKVERREDHVIVTGWADAAEVRLVWPGGQYSVTPDVTRADVAERRGLRADVGFELVAPVGVHPLSLLIDRDGSTALTVAIPHPSDPPTRAAHRRLNRAFMRDFFQASPSVWRYLRHPAERTKTDLKRALRLDVSTRGQGVQPAWLADLPMKPDRSSAVTLIVPVYNALALLQRCLARVEAHTDVPWHMILVDDASTDPAVRPWLTAWAKARPTIVTLVTQDENKGFVGTVNSALTAALDRGGSGPVVLLNTDAMVASGWASRLIAPLNHPGVASVTPMSNAAEIFTIPQICRGLDLAEGEVDKVDAVAATFGDVTLPNAPTGVGFCMAISRDWLVRVPQLDTAFGRGYGEEVDWCQKTRALGARHVCQPSVFVEHIGGQSFGSDEKLARVRRANALIASRYPTYDAEVQQFIADDPLATPRLALAIALAGLRAKRLPLFLAHSMGGGAEAALLAEMAQHDAALVLRVGGPSRWQLEVHLGGQSTAGQTSDLAVIQLLLANVPSLDIIYSCGVGDSDPVTLPTALLLLKRPNKDDRIAMRFHDYYPISPSYTLLGQGGYVGVPPIETPDLNHTAHRTDGSRVSLKQWRKAWAPLVEASHEVVVFSSASSDLVGEAFPSAPLTVRPHTSLARIRPVKPGALHCFGVLGNVNLQKGAFVLRDIATAHPDLTFVVIGHADSAIALPNNITLHGSYRPEDIADLTEHYAINAWLFPAIWPETFSYATREALATGLMVAGFDLGAQGEILRQTSNGCVVPLDPITTAHTRLFAALRETTATLEVAQ